LLLRSVLVWLWFLGKGHGWFVLVLASAPLMLAVLLVSAMVELFVVEVLSIVVSAVVQLLPLPMVFLLSPPMASWSLALVGTTVSFEQTRQVWLGPVLVPRMLACSRSWTVSLPRIVGLGIVTIRLNWRQTVIDH
jgi:hypothetical protein